MKKLGVLLFKRKYEIWSEINIYKTVKNYKTEYEQKDSAKNLM